MAAEYTATDVSKSGRRTESDESDVQHGVREYLARGKDKVMELEEGLEGYIQEYPIRSILIAAGVGVIVGALVSRR